MATVSVVLPAYNASKTITRAVDSILAQEYTGWELIIVNDGSTDSTLSDLQAYQCPRVSLHSIPHGGIARALNFGIKISKGRHIARMDADDVCHPSRLGEQVQFLEQHPEIGLVSSCVQYRGERYNQFGYAYYVDSINAIVDENEIYNKRFTEAPFPHPSVMFRKSLFYQHGGYQKGPLPEDFELWLRWFHRGVRMHKLAKNLLTWHDDTHRLSRTHPNYTMGNFFRIKARYFKKWYIQNQPKGPKLWVFGAGKDVNKRTRHFEEEGLRIERFIDVKHKSLTSKFIHYEDIPQADGSLLILSMVSDRQGKLKIMDFLLNKGYKEGSTFFMMA